MIHKKKRFVFKLQTLDNEDRTYQNETTWTWRKLSKLYIKRNALNHRFRISATQCYPKMFKLLRGNCIRSSLLFFHKWYRNPSKMGRLIKLSHGRSWVIIFKDNSHLWNCHECDISSLDLLVLASHNNYMYLHMHFILSYVLFRISNDSYTGQDKILK